MPKVSVVIPVYGVEKYIERCARSLFEQTLNDMEFIFVDDRTPDHSIEILRSIIDEYRLRFEEKNYTVKIVQMPVNSGQAAVRRHGIQLALGDYVINCDSDDWVDIEMYEKMYDHAILYDSDLIICDYIITNGDKNSDIVFKKNITDCSKKSIFIRLVTTSALNPVWSAMAKRELFENIMFPLGAMGEDKTIMIQLAWRAKNVTYLQKPLYYYYLSESSILRTNNMEFNVCKFKQSIENKILILDFIKREKIEVTQMQIDAMLFTSKIGLIEKYLLDRKCRNLWLYTFPLKIKNVMFNKYIGIKSRVYYALLLFMANLMNNIQHQDNNITVSK